MIRRLRRRILAAAVLVTAVGTVHAGITINITQVGSDVVVTGSGTINLAGFTDSDPGSFEAQIAPSTAQVVTGLVGGLNNIVAYEPMNGPTSLGTVEFATPTSGSGDAFGVLGFDKFILVPQGYVSGDPLSATDTYDGTTISAIGLIPGTYTWTWGSGSNADSLTVQIGTAAVVPEPASAILASIGAAVAFIAYGWYRHRREHQRRQAAA